MNQPIPIAFVIVGPTASGKSNAAVQLSQRFNGEVISADSVQVYRGLDIASGKITTSETQGVTHHLLDAAEPGEVFTVENFRFQGNTILADILSRGKTPIIAGGTGFYIDTLVNNFKYPVISANIKSTLDSLEPTTLMDLARKELPVEIWNSFDNQNRVRVRNRLGLWQTYGHIPPVTKIPREFDINFVWLGLNPGKDILRDRIRNRTQQRLQNGMTKEVQTLLNSGISADWLRSVGLTYRVIINHLEQNTSTEELAKELVIKEIQYAKRQLTWFKRNKKITWYESFEKILDDIKS